MDRMESVPAGLPWEQQVRIAQGQRDATTRMVESQRTPTPAQLQHQANAIAQQCAALSEEVARWDATARRALSGQYQDYVRQRRQAARDRQFALGC